MKNRFFCIIGLIAIFAFANLSCGGGDDDNGPGGSVGGGGLSNNIDSALFGTWQDNMGGTSLTITFSANGITWGGTAGSSINSAANSFQGSGYDFAWIADNGTISYKYQYQNGDINNVPVYTYSINSSGELELGAASSPGTVFMTLVRGGSPVTPPVTGSLTNDIDSALYGTWSDNMSGYALTITFSETGIVWGGTSGNAINNAANSYQGSGYDFAWIANNGTISYKYSYNGGSINSVPVYTYDINSSGELELSAASMPGLVIMTLVRGGSPGTPPVTGSLTNDIDPALYGTWYDNLGGTALTITLSETGIVWGGSAGSSINSATATYQGTGYDFVWIVNSGTISYKYSYNGGSINSVPVYTYDLNSSGELELGAASMPGMVIMTLVKEGTITVTTYTVSFNGNGGSAVADITGVTSGDTISAPAEPTIMYTDLNQGRFRGWYTDDGTFENAYDFSTPVTGDVTLYADWGYRPGDTGPAGGKIFYRNESGFTVEASDVAVYIAYYLEAAPSDSSSSAEWGAFGTLISGVTTFTSSSYADASKIGNGRKDTQLIVAHLGTSETGCAAQLCKSADFGGYNDWFLPSLGELNELYKLYDANMKGSYANLSEGWYWSSSQYNSNYHAWSQYFYYGYQDYYGKNVTHRVRAVRAF